MQNTQTLPSDKVETANLIIDFVHRTIVHHGLWYAEATHQLGPQKAQDILQKVSKKSINLQINRLAQTLDFEVENSIPKFLLSMPQDKLDELKDSLAVNWLANDGVWFQEVEKAKSMIEAKRCNDSCWAQFSPVEASSIKELLKLKKDCGLEGLKLALGQRIYASINEQSIVDETQNSFVFQMNTCRVQAARKRKNLDDYPCKSAGVAEYSTFAETIDSRITTECIGCPPDKHPDNWYCAWKFSIKTGE
ncbi:MAG: cytosolic protein [Bacteriovoracaceae bacterium]|nr:cytosolic protein [Bacteriovoracaceae bacterium]